jgi:CubicO group peptidase (beta-lactamase class C family)
MGTLARLARMKSVLRSTGFWLAFVCATAIFARGESPSIARGLDPRKLPEIRRRMEEFVRDGTVAGAVTLVARDGVVADLSVVGFSDLEKKLPMRANSLFWIASMTKPITATAVMMLADAGKLSIDDPVDKYLPEFKEMWMVSEKSPERVTLIPASRKITLHDLLTHTSGLDDVAAPRGDCSLAELTLAYAQRPLKFAPGSRWEYCNSGINVLGRIVEVVSGKKFEQFLQHQIFDPLLMKDTTFWPEDADLKRVAKTYKPAQAGRGLEETGIYFLKGELSDRRRTPFPAGGLFSTAEDMARFYQMMLNEGEWRGKRILSKSAVAAMTHTQSGELKTGFTDGMSWGLGFQVVKNPAGVTGMLSPGTFGHGGAYATQSWADPKERMLWILMIQRAGFPNGDASPVRQAFQETIYSNLNSGGQ